MNAFTSVASCVVLATVAMFLQGCAMFGASAGPPAVCAEKEGDLCNCTGNVTYGLTFAKGKPGAGNKTTFEEMTAKAFKSIKVNKSITCSAAKMGGDPLPGYLKSCWCIPSMSRMDRLKAAAAKMKAHAQEMAAKAKAKASEAAEKAKAAAADAKAKASEAAEAAKAKAGEMTDAAKAKASKAAESAKAKAAELKAKASELKDKAKAAATTADADAADIDEAMPDAATLFNTQDVGFGSSNFFPVFGLGCASGVLMMSVVLAVNKFSSSRVHPTDSDSFRAVSLVQHGYTGTRGRGCDAEQPLE